MSSYTLQIVVLAAAYVLLVGAGVANGLVSLYNWRLISRLEGRKDLGARVTRLENEVTSYRELLDTFSKRLNRRDGSKASKRSSNGTDASGDGLETPLTSEELLRRFHAGELQ